VNQTFELSGETMDKLNKLGIGQLVVNIGTWVVRIKEFFMGMADTIGTAFSFVWSVVSTVFNAIFDALKMVFPQLAKNTAAIDQFAMAGKIMGVVVVAALVAIGIAAASAAISMIVAFFPVILVIAAIAAAVWVVIQVFNILAAAISYIWEGLKSMFEWGANLVSYIWEGIKSGWRSFTNWIWDSVTSVPLIGPAIKWLFGDTEDAGSDLGDTAAGMGDNPDVLRAQEEMGSSGVMENSVENKGVGMEAFKSETFFKVQPQETIIQLDGNEIGRATTNYQSNEISRQ